MEIITNSVIRVVESLPFFAIMLLGLWFSKLFFDLTTSYKFDSELTEKDNPAFGVTLAGYLAGTGIAFANVYLNFETATATEWLVLGIDVLLVVLLMRISVIINDKLIFFKYSVTDELINDRNTGTGFVIAGGALATGWMLNGVLSGSSESLGLMIRDILIYWVIGQVLLIIGGQVYQKLTSYDIHQSIGGDNNVAAGLAFGGFLMALGMICRNALSGATSAIGEELQVTLVFALSGLILLSVTSVVVDRIFLPKANAAKEIAEQRNIAAGVISAASYIVTAIIFTSAVSPH